MLRFARFTVTVALPTSTVWNQHFCYPPTDHPLHRAGACFALGLTTNVLGGPVFETLLAAEAECWLLDCLLSASYCLLLAFFSELGI